jgi:hypothetical protein
MPQFLSDLQGLQKYFHSNPWGFEQQILISQCMWGTVPYSTWDPCTKPYMNFVWTFRVLDKFGHLQALERLGASLTKNCFRTIETKPLVSTMTFSGLAWHAKFLSVPTHISCEI